MNFSIFLLFFGAAAAFSSSPLVNMHKNRMAKHRAIIKMKNRFTRVHSPQPQVYSKTFAKKFLIALAKQLIAMKNQEK